METRLRKLNTSQLTEICRKMKCSSGSKKEMIKNLLQPLRKKYKMENIKDPYLKNYMSKYYTDSELGALRATSRSQENLQPILDKRGAQHLKQVKKWNNIIKREQVRNRNHYVRHLQQAGLRPGEFLEDFDDFGRQFVGEEVYRERDSDELIKELEKNKFRDLSEILYLAKNGFIGSENKAYLIDRTYKYLVNHIHEDNESVNNILKHLREITVHDNRVRGIMLNRLLYRLLRNGSENIEKYKILLENGANIRFLRNKRYKNLVFKILNRLPLNGLPLYSETINAMLIDLVKTTIEDDNDTVEMYKTLLARGADPIQTFYCPDARRTISLLNHLLEHHLYDRGSEIIKIINIMRKYGARGFELVNGIQKYTPELIIDVFLENKNKVKETLKNNTNIDINAKYNGETALEYALDERNFDIAKILIDHGADVNLIDEKGFSLLDRVSRRRLFDPDTRRSVKDEKGIEFLKKNGAKSAK